MKRLLCACLALALLTGCAEGKPPAGAQSASAEERALAVLAACGRDAEELERTDRLLEQEALEDYIANYYALAAEDWTACAIYRAGGAEAFEVAVLELSGDADMDAVLDGLMAYIDAREGDFTGYSPAQAALVREARAVGTGSAADGTARFAALLICEDAAAAEAAFTGRAAEETEGPAPVPVSDEPDPESPAPAPPSPDPSSGASAAEPEPIPSQGDGPARYPGRVTFVRPGIDDMTVYDSSAIRAAWASGDTSQLTEEERTLYDRCKEVLDSLLKEGMSDYRKELAVYDWLRVNAVYDEDHQDNLAELDPASNTPYGPLVNGKGICIGFANSFQLLMDLCGVECITVVGASHQSTGDHAWNMVRLDGDWYCVDVTWDLGKGRVKRYFNVTSDWMAKTDHQWDYASVPEAVTGGGGR